VQSVKYVICHLFCFKFVVLFSFYLKQNPSKPNFNHYLFETFGVLIRAVCIKNRLLIQKFEAHLFPIFNYVLEQDITEFIPYAFQLLSLMLELQDQSIPQVYHELFPFLLMPVLWERPGYVPALVRLLQAYIEKSATTIVVEKIVRIAHFFFLNYLFQFQLKRVLFWVYFKD